MVSNDVGRERYPSDEELVRVPLDLYENDEPARRMTLAKRSVKGNSHGYV